jgi:hypothetical protein
MLRLFAAGLLLGSAALAQSRVAVVVELFTSEGCSSCPPADALLAQMEQSQPVAGAEIIALGEHVDYWDHLGWKDRFSSPLFSARQEDYGRVFRAEGVYTPQVVVNGQAQTLGSDRQAVQQAIRSVAQGPRASVEIGRRGLDTVTLRVHGLPKETKGADLLLAITESDITTSVERGENRGRLLRHVAVVRSLTSLGYLDPKKDGAYTAEARLNLQPEWSRQNVKVVLLVQDRATRQILGAASMRL